MAHANPSCFDCATLSETRICLRGKQVTYFSEKLERIFIPSFIHKISSCLLRVGSHSTWHSSSAIDPLTTFMSWGGSTILVESINSGPLVSVMTSKQKAFVVVVVVVVVVWLRKVANLWWKVQWWCWRCPQSCLPNICTGPYLPSPLCESAGSHSSGENISLHLQSPLGLLFSYKTNIELFTVLLK